ncbi:UNVERIFIED_CONTAM: hypothetical protein Sindi_0822500 [Sesamum indicum]
MFNKLMTDHVLGGCARGTPTPRSSKGVLAYSESKGKHLSSSFSPGPVVGSSSKRLHGGPFFLSSIPAPSSPSSKENMDTPLRSSCTSSARLYSRQSLDQERGKYPMVADLRRGVLPLGDKHLLAPLAREELNEMATSYLFKLEKDLRKIQKEVAGHERALKKAVLDFPNSEEGKNYLEFYRESHFKEFKKSEGYQQEVTKIARPYFEHGFIACKEQFQA